MSIATNIGATVLGAVVIPAAVNVAPVILAQNTGVRSERPRDAVLTDSSPGVNTALLLAGVALAVIGSGFVRVTGGALAVSSFVSLAFPAQREVR